MLPPIPWAKLRRETNPDSVYSAPIAWLSLVDHSADVAAVVETMLSTSVVARRLSCLAGIPALGEQMRQRLCVFAALHDFGKANVGFQSRWRLGAAIVGHCPEALIALNDESTGAALGGVLPFAEMMTWGALDNPMLAALSHHGRPLDARLSGRERLVHWTPQRGLNPVASLGALGAAVRQWFPDAFQPDGAVLPERPAFWHGFAGLLTLADWVASDEAIFPLLPLYEGGDPGRRMAVSRRRADEVLQKIGFDPRASRTTSVAGLGFKAISPHAPRPVQEATAAWSAQHRILALESETGSGKTEAALARFARLFAAGEVDGLYFALPTRVAATSLHGRVVAAVERMFPDPASRPHVVLAVPGTAPAENANAPAMSPPFGGVDVWDGSADRAQEYSAWAADRPKKYLAGTIAVGTIDQALLGIIAVKHAHLRLASLMRHLLVVDEVHASDRYMSGLLRALLRFHGKAGGHALLLSATLGASARAALLDDDDPPDLAESIAAPYPAISSDGHPTPVAQPWEGRLKSVSLHMSQAIAEPETIALLALQAAGRGAKVLVIRNLRRDAIDVFDALMRQAPDHPALFRCAGIPTLHHGRFAREDRARLDLAVEEAIGRERPQGGLVLVGTQTLEQSLDIDADYLITDLSPADVLLQRIGRLHRHQRKGRPAGYHAPQAVVLTPPNMDALLGRRGGHGIGGEVNPYADILAVEATRRLVAEHPVWTIPTMNRELVERATHDDALRALLDQLARDNPRWRKAYEDVLGRSFAMTRQANEALLKTDAHFWSAEVVFGSDAMIGTRLGARDLSICFDAPARGPFGGDVQNVAIPGHWMGGVDVSDVPVDISVACIGSAIRFDLAGKSFVYDTRGLLVGCG